MAFPSAVRALDTTSLGEPFRAALPEYLRTGRLSLFEKAGHRLLHLEAVRAARRDPLGIGVAIGYLWLKAGEVADLRLICRAAHIGLPRDELSAELSRAIH